MTPNGDGVNDNFYFNTEGLRAVDIGIFDRWGRLVYGWTDLNGYWNGKNSKSSPVPDGVYFYVANVTTYDYKTHELKGFIHVYR